MKTIYKIGLAVGLIIIIVGAIGGYYLYNKQHKDLGKAKPDYVITAIDLLKEFEKDEIAASEKYVSKIIEVSGTIESFNTGKNNTLSIILKTDSDFSTVICTFLQAQDREEFKSGDEITVRGECSGFLTDVLLNNCSLVK